MIQPTLIALMSRPKLNWAWKIEPEQRLCIEFADELRALTIEGRYKGVWVHVPNEGKRHIIVAMILKAMGLIPGAFDYWFVWEGGAGLIEMKVGSIKLKGNQALFDEVCAHYNINRATCNSKETAIETLKQWKAIL